MICVISHRALTFTSSGQNQKRMNYENSLAQGTSSSSPGLLKTAINCLLEDQEESDSLSSLESLPSLFRSAIIIIAPGSLQSTIANCVKLYGMKVPSIRLPPDRAVPMQQEGSEYPFTSTRVESRKMVLLSLRRPLKPNKIDVRQILSHQARPIFAQPLSSPVYPTKKKEFKVRSFASKSVHQVISKRTPQASPTSDSAELLDSERLVSIPYKAVRLGEDFARITRSFGIVANVRQSDQAGVKQTRYRKNRTTFYVNNFMRTRYSRAKDSRPVKMAGLGEKQERYQIFPWEKEKPLDSEEDNFLNN